MLRFWLIALVLLSSMSIVEAHYYAIDHGENSEKTKVRFHLGTLAGGEERIYEADLLFRTIYLTLPDAVRKEVALFQEDLGRFEFAGGCEGLITFLQIFDQLGKQMLNSAVVEESFVQAKKMYLDMLRKEGADDAEVKKVEAISYDDIDTSKSRFQPVLSTMLQLAKELSPDAPQRKQLSIEEESFHLFHTLRLTASDTRNIDHLIDYLSMPWYKLMRHSGKVNRLGDEIRPVHPLRFIGYILSHPKLRKKLYHDIQGSSLVWGKFIQGFGERMHREKHHNNLNQYVPGFSQSLGIPTQIVYQYIVVHEWELLLKELMHRLPH